MLGSLHKKKLGTDMRTNRISGRVVWFSGALLTTLLTLSTLNAAAGKIYRCVDEKTQKVTVSDSPCQYSAPTSPAADKDKNAADLKLADKKAADKKLAEKSDGKAAAPALVKDAKN
jgi:hypothetical protein